MSAALALDIGGTHVTAAVVEGSVLRAQHSQAVDSAGSAESILDAWAGAARLALQEAGSAVTALGVAMPGPFDYPAGISQHVTKFVSLQGMDVRAALKARLELEQAFPVHFLNDAGCFALGEALFGQGAGQERVIGLTLGTGIGSGFIADGRVCRAGPAVPPDGQVWWTPYRGGVTEDYVGTVALMRAYRERSGHVLKPRAIADAARAGDRAAAEVFAQMGHDLGCALLPWVEGFRPQSVILGGGISRSLPLFEAPLRAALPADLPIVLSVLGEQAALLGAAKAALDTANQAALAMEETR